MFEFGTGQNGTKLPLDLMFKCAVNDFLLGRKRMAMDQIIAACHRYGKTLRGHPNQCYSWMKRGISNAIATGDAQILALCTEYGIDPEKPFSQQDRVKIKEIIDAKIAARQGDSNEK